MPQQQQLFEIEPAPWELDAAAEQSVATVVFPEGPAESYDYSVPDGLRGEIEPGRRVRVPFGRGNRLVDGYCVKLESRNNLTRRLKPLAQVVDSHTLLAPAMLRLAEWMADYYLCNLGQALEGILPAGVRASAGTRRITLLSLAPEEKRRLLRGEFQSSTAGQASSGTQQASSGTPSSPSSTHARFSRQQLEIIRYLSDTSEPIEPRQLARAVKCTLGPVTALRRKGILVATTKRISAETEREAKAPRQQNLELNADQQRALDGILEPLRCTAA